jgi:hypothetical protein
VRVAEGAARLGEPEPRTAPDWRRFVAVALGTFVAALAALGGFVLLADPYDTGRLTPFDAGGMPLAGPRLAFASLGRDPRYDSAIVGNSTIQLLSPERLARLGAGRFVQLSIPGTGPIEQLYVLEWFRRHHAATSALLIGLDWTWCQPAARLDRAAVLNPFPFWLVSPSDAEYVAALLSAKNLDAAVRRLNFKLRGKGKPQPPDGFNDYEAERTYDAGAVAARLADGAAMARVAPPAAPAAARDMASPAFIGLGEALARFSPETRKVLVFLPVHAASLPPPGSAPAQAWARCKEDAARLAADVPGTTVVDFLERAPLTEAAENWWDAIHYRRSIAEFIERRLGPLLASSS